MTLALVWVWVATMPLAFLDPEYGAWLAKEQMLAACHLGPVVVVGNSRAAAGILPALLPMKTTNLAVGGGEPIAAVAAVRRALACPHPPRLVLIAFGPGQFVRPDLFWERTVRFGFLDDAEISRLAARSRALGDWSVYDNGHGDGLPGRVRQALYEWHFPSVYFASLAQGGVFLRYWEGRRMLARTRARRGQYFFGTAPGCDQVALAGHLQRFRPLPVLNAYFDQLLYILTARRVAVAFVSMPLNQATARAVRPQVRRAFAAYLHSYQRRYPGLRLIGPMLNGWPDALFGDAFSHLNPRGARLFSRKLGACLAGRHAACALDWHAAPAQTAATKPQEGA